MLAPLKFYVRILKDIGKGIEREREGKRKRKSESEKEREKGTEEGNTQLQNVEICRSRNDNAEYNSIYCVECRDAWKYRSDVSRRKRLMCKLTAKCQSRFYGPILLAIFLFFSIFFFSRISFFFLYFFPFIYKLF